ncbi:hypothetical protein C8J57DRAFT_1565016 [Mycena rebaudengoi]|nr:hypothetical protein C8J57DRAFT_1565016 [Mycena rebaudengoi]
MDVPSDSEAVAVWPFYDIHSAFSPFAAPTRNAIYELGAAFRNLSDIVQFLVHGFTYTNQYWSPSIEEFRNYSYSAFSCDRGLSSLAINWVGVGLSSRPVNASDVPQGAK